MVGENSTLWGGLTAAGTLFIMNYIIKFILYFFPKIGKIVQEREVLLVYNFSLLKVAFTKRLFKN
jgi:hypothetical protein